MSTIRLNLPTVLTLGRILLIPVFVIVAPESHVLGIIVFLVAALTDFLDGFLARRSGEITKFGIILDPIADKLLVIAALIVLVDMVLIAAWVATVIIVREFVVTTLRFLALSRNIVMAAETCGKLKTTSQMTAIVLLLLPGGIGDFDFYDAGLLLMYLAVILAVVSAVRYIISFWKQLQ